MKILLYILSAVAFILFLLLTAKAKTVFHEIVGGTMLITSSVFFSSATIMFYLEKIAKKIWLYGLKEEKHD